MTRLSPLMALVAAMSFTTACGPIDIPVDKEDCVECADTGSTDSGITDTGITDTGEADSGITDSGDADTDTDSDSDTDSDTDTDSEIEGNLKISIAYPWGDGDVLYLDYEAVSDRAYLGAISGEAWEDAGGPATVIDGVATWSLDVGYGMDAVRFDVDFPDGGNVCEGYGDSAHLLVDVGVTYGVETWSVWPYSMEWTSDGVTYQGCSGSAYDG